MIVQVIIDIAHANIDKSYSYYIPEHMTLELGHHVHVPFGQNNKLKEGFIVSFDSQPDIQGVQLKYVYDIIEPFPVFSAEQLLLAQWMKQTYNCLLVDALRLMIPSQLRGGRVKEKKERIISLADKQIAQEYMQNTRSQKQRELLSLLLKSAMPLSTKDIAKLIPGAAASIRTLADRGILLEDKISTFRQPHYEHLTHSLPALEAEQAKALLDMEAMVPGSIALLRGVTGSGKTEVYLRCIEKCTQEGKGAIVLVPEIALTPQTVSRFVSRFGDKIAVLHSGLSAGERFDEWRRIRLGLASIIIGARSAVFAPVDNLQLIIIDEEHESSYQSEAIPRYHAFDVARKRMSLLNGKVLLGSATPSLLSYYRAISGSYTLLELNKRVENRPMPPVHIEDMREEFLSGNNGIFSTKLLTLLKECFRNGQQAMLFINRRGYSTFVSCRSCGYVLSCDNCDISLTYHKSENRSRCHYCGAIKPLPKECPQCGKAFIKHFGVGTEQVEEQLLRYFPQIKSLRMDTDTVGNKGAYEQILSSFRRREAHVLIGTQMIAKGHDFPHVTVVGVISADTSLNYPDYRSSERTFQLLSQVAGRAGRSEESGQVVLQSYNPDHPVFGFVKHHDYVGFYHYEIAQRKKSLYPPFSLFLRIILHGKEEEDLNKDGQVYAKALEATILKALGAEGARDLLLLHASPAPVSRIAGLYRYQILCKLLRTKRLPDVLQAVYIFENSHREEGIGRIEINPQDMY